MKLSPLIEAAELLQIIYNEDIVLIDASNGINASVNYRIQHIFGAIYLDLNSQLAEIPIDFAHGGRHPLPTIENFLSTVSDLGINNQSHVIIYDNNQGANAAARFWWMLKAIGHEKVQVLNGGIQEAFRINIPMSNKGSDYKKTAEYNVSDWILKTADIQEVENASMSQKHIIIDVRSTDRFNGETEPIDLVAGHIPGAINIPFTENLDGNGLFLSKETMREKYESIFNAMESENIVVHCGSGVTACHTLLAVAHAGLPIPKLYVGSWSEWSRNNKTIITKK